MPAVRDHRPGDVVGDQPERLRRFGSAPARFGAAAADGEHRHFQAQPGFQQRAVVGHVARNVAVERETGAQRTRLGVGAQIFIDVRRAEGAALPRKILVEPGEVGALAARDQRFRQVRRHVERMVPALAALRDVRADAGQGHIQYGEGTDGLAMGRSQRECGWPAPVMPHQMPAFEAEGSGEQFPQVGGHSFLVIAAKGAGAVAQAAQVGRDDAIARADQGNDVAPLVPGGRPAMHQNHRVAGAGAHVVQRGFGEAGVMVFDVHGGGVSVTRRVDYARVAKRLRHGSAAPPRRRPRRAMWLRPKRRRGRIADRCPVCRP